MGTSSTPDSFTCIYTRAWRQNNQEARGASRPSYRVQRAVIASQNRAADPVSILRNIQHLIEIPLCILHEFPAILVQELHSLTPV
eukprot:scaffold624_cov402-Prasinococcus_capsulatus_cf.AAC.22